MGKVNASAEKTVRNQAYAMRYKQKTCERCKHKSARGGACKMCGGKMKP